MQFTGVFVFRYSLFTGITLATTGPGLPVIGSSDISFPYLTKAKKFRTNNSVSYGW